MSSPGALKVTRPVPSWPKDHHTSVAAMDTNDLLRRWSEGWHHREGKIGKEHRESDWSGFFLGCFDFFYWQYHYEMTLRIANKQTGVKSRWTGPRHRRTEILSWQFLIESTPRRSPTHISDSVSIDVLHITNRFAVSCPIYSCVFVPGYAHGRG